MSDRSAVGTEAEPAVPAAVKAVVLLDRLSFAAIVVTMAAMTVLVAAQVLFRYALSSSIDSADELSRLFFVWSIFLALPHGIRYGVHVGIDLLPLALSQKLQDLMFRAMNLVSVGLMIVVGVVTYAIIVDKWAERMPTLPISAALYYMPVLISCVHAMLHMALLVWNGPRLWKDERF